MMQSIVPTQDPAVRDFAMSLLTGPCVQCGHRAHVMLLLDAEPEPFVLCETCAVRLRVPTLDLPSLLLATLARDEFVPAVLFSLNLSQAYRQGRVPLERFDVFDAGCWGRA